MLPKSDSVAYAEQHPETTKLLPSGKLRFTQTGMEFPANADFKTLETYVSGKAYRRALARRRNERYDFDQHLPYIVPHKHRDEQHFLYCVLTNCTLPRQRDVIEAHTNGKKYKRKYEEAQKEKKDRKERIAKRKAHETDHLMQDDGANDVLDGLLSSEEESESHDIEMDDDAGASEDKRDKRSEHTELDDHHKSLTSKYMHNGMDVENEKTPIKGSPNGVQRTLSDAKQVAGAGSTPSSIKAREFASKKRRRPNTPVPKRVRHTRQKRRTDGF